MQIAQIPRKFDLQLDNFYALCPDLKRLCSKYQPHSRFSSGAELLSYIMDLQLIVQIVQALASCDSENLYKSVKTLKGFSWEEAKAELQHKQTVLNGFYRETCQIAENLLEEGLDVTGYLEDYAIEQELANDDLGLCDDAEDGAAAENDVETLLCRALQ